jgi:hypothetical protein
MLGCGLRHTPTYTPSCFSRVVFLVHSKMLSVTSWRGMRAIMRLSWRAQPTAYPSELEG